MKKITKNLLVSLFLLVFSAGSVAQDFTSAHDYLAYILQNENIVANNMWNYIKISAHSNSDKKIERKKDKLIQTIKEVSHNIGTMPPFEGDAALRDSLVVFFERSIEILNGDFEEVEKLELEANTSYQAMKKYLNAQSNANQNYSEANNKILEQVDYFAEQNNLELIADNSKLNANLKISNIVYDYYNKFYLIFFRGYIEDTYIIDAVNMQDTTKLKIHIDSLTSAYTTGKAEIGNLLSYNGDNSLKLACQNALNHYKKEATVQLPIIINFFRVDAELRKVKAEYEAIPEAEITQDDVNKYNFTISKYNTAIGEYNETIEIMNNELKENYKQWTKAVEKFLKNHIPK